VVVTKKFSVAPRQSLKFKDLAADVVVGL